VLSSDSEEVSEVPMCDGRHVLPVPHKRTEKPNKRLERLKVKRKQGAFAVQEVLTIMDTSFRTERHSSFELQIANYLMDRIERKFARVDFEPLQETFSIEFLKLEVEEHFLDESVFV